MRYLLTILLLLLFACGYSQFVSVIGGGVPGDEDYTKYVAPDGSGDNGDPGTEGEPWETLEYAVTQTISGQTIYLQVGTHTLSDSVSLPVGVNLRGASIATTTILSNFKSGATNYREATICLHSTSEGTDGNQSISHLTLDGNDTTATKGIAVVMRSNVSIENCSIVNFENGAVLFEGMETYRTVPSTFAIGNQIINSTIKDCSHLPPTNGDADVGFQGSIDIAGQDGLLLENNIFIDSTRTNPGSTIDGVVAFNKNLRITGNDSYRTYHGADEAYSFHVEMWDSEGGFQVDNNNFYGGLAGIDFGGKYAKKGASSYSWWIHDNLFWQKHAPDFGDGTSYFGIDAEGGSKYVIIESNHFVNPGYGIHIDVPAYMTNYPTLDKTAEHYKIYNNIIENAGYSGTTYGGGIVLSMAADTAYIKDISIVNNVITTDQEQGVTAYGGVWIICQDTLHYMEGIKIHGNIITDFTYGAVLVDGDNGAAPWGALDTLITTYNLFYNNGNSDDVEWWNSIRTTEITESNTIKTDPLFVDEANDNYHIYSTSDGVDAGLTVSWYTVDYDDDAVGDPPNTGIYEVVITP